MTFLALLHECFDQILIYVVLELKNGPTAKTTRAAATAAHIIFKLNASIIYILSPITQLFFPYAYHESL